jgi:hypothetical protein
VLVAEWPWTGQVDEGSDVDDHEAESHWFILWMALCPEHADLYFFRKHCVQRTAHEKVAMASGKA